MKQFNIKDINPENEDFKKVACKSGAYIEWTDGDGKQVDRVAVLPKETFEKITRAIQRMPDNLRRNL